MLVPLSVAAQDADVLSLILKHAHLTAASLRLAGTCRQWRLGILARWGPMRLLSHQPSLLIGAPEGRAIQYPTGITWVGSDLCIVESFEQKTSTCAGRVSLFSTAGEQKELLCAERYGGVSLGRTLAHIQRQGPTAAVSDGRALYIAHSNVTDNSWNALYKLSLPDYTLTHSFTDNNFLIDPEEEDEEEQYWDVRLGAPAALTAVGPSLYVLDMGGESGDASVSIFSAADLQFQSKFGAAADGYRHGSGDGELSFPEDMIEHDGELYIADTSNHRVQVFSLEGAFVRTIGGGLDRAYEQGIELPPGALDAPVGLCIFRERLVVAEHQYVTGTGHQFPRSTAGCLTVFCVDGTPLERIVLDFWPSRLCANAEYLFCCDYCGRRVYKFGALA
jgi:hypothetical protein